MCTPHLCYKHCPWLSQDEDGNYHTNTKVDQHLGMIILAVDLFVVNLDPAGKGFNQSDA